MTTSPIPASECPAPAVTAPLTRPERRRTPRTILVQRIVAVLLFGCGACEIECDGSDGVDKKPDGTVEYSPSAVQGWVGIEFASPEATATYLVDRYEIGSTATQLPPGLALDKDTGQITGTPSAPQPPTQYTITGVEVFPGGNSTVAFLTIEIHDAVAPADLSYAPNPIAGAQGDSIADSVPSFTGGVQSFSVSPPLPTGLVLDADTGVISGSLNGAAGDTQHVVTALNPFGGTPCTVEVNVAAASTIEGLLVASAADLTVDAFAFDGDGVDAIDFEHFNGATPRAVAPTSDGSRVYVAASDSILYLLERDPLSGELGLPQSLGNAGSIQRLLVSPGDQYLFAVADGEARRYAIQANGSILASGTAQGPNFGASAILVGPGGAYLAVGATSPGALWIYDISPEFALRGEPLSFDSFDSVDELLARSDKLYAATSAYSLATSSFTGHLRSFSVATAAEVAGGAPVLDPRDDIVLGEHLTSLAFLPPSLPGLTIAITDDSLARVYLMALDAGDDFDLPAVTHATPGFPLDCVAKDTADGPILYVLDSNNAMLRSLDLSSPSLAVVASTKTRSFANELIAVRGLVGHAHTQAAFVPGSVDTDLRALPYTAPGGFAATAQAPLATGAGAWDAVAHPFLPVVYTAERDAAAIGVYAWDVALQQLALVEDEALLGGSQPIALALGLGGSTLFIADGTGIVTHASVDPLTGELAASGGSVVTGSMANARLCADPIGRFVFLVQPVAGRVTSLSVMASSGFPLVTATSTAVTTPVDVAVSEDGRYVYVLDGDAANVSVFRLDAVSGDLIPVAGGIGVGAGPRLLELADWSGASQLFVLDPTLEACLVLARNETSGALSAGAFPSIDLAAGASALASFEVDGVRGPLFAFDGDGTGSFEAHRLDAQTGFELLSALPVGDGPRAIAVRNAAVPAH